MEWFVAVGALVVVAVLIVGLFHGPSHRAHRAAPPSSAPTPSPADAPAPVAPITPPGLTDPPAYVLPPPQGRRHLPRRHTTGPRGRRS